MQKTRQRLILLLLALFFLAPGFSAYFFYTHPGWIKSSKTNKGSLQSHPSRLVLPHTAKKWHLVLWYPKSCGAICEKTIEKLLRIRLALGRQWYDVDQWLVGPRDFILPLKLEEIMHKNASYTYTLNKKASFLTQEPKIFLVDPEYFWILQYSIDAQPVDIFSDLKKVLAKNQ